MLESRDDIGYKLVTLEGGESCEEGVIRPELKDWPPDRIFIIKFVSANDDLIL